MIARIFAGNFLLLNNSEETGGIKEYLCRKQPAFNELVPV